MILHPRARLVNSAKADLRIAIGEWLKQHDLTTAEELMLLASVPNDIINSTMRAIIKMEREEGSDAPSTGLPTGA